MKKFLLLFLTLFPIISLAAPLRAELLSLDCKAEKRRKLKKEAEILESVTEPWNEWEKSGQKVFFVFDLSNQTGDFRVVLENRLARPMTSLEIKPSFIDAERDDKRLGKHRFKINRITGKFEWNFWGKSETYGSFEWKGNCVKSSKKRLF